MVMFLGLKIAPFVIMAKTTSIIANIRYIEYFLIIVITGLPAAGIFFAISIPFTLSEHPHPTSPRGGGAKTLPPTPEGRS
jgi:hypothetical protein